MQINLDKVNIIIVNILITKHNNLSDNLKIFRIVENT